MAIDQRSSTRLDDEEKAIWDLLIRDFLWTPPTDGNVKLLLPQGKPIKGAKKFQLFEVLIASVLASTRPDYEWSVSPNQPDRGTDFVGRSHLLRSEALQLDAVITIGGQCKKRQKVKDLIGEVDQSLTRMTNAYNPTLFLVAFSARLGLERVKEARQAIERARSRHCHIMERGQIEGLLASHLKALTPLLGQALAPGEVQRVIAYLTAARTNRYALTASVNQRVLAGQPFDVVLDIVGMPDESSGLQLRWLPTNGGHVSLIGFPGLDRMSGASITRDNALDDDPMAMRLSLPFVSYAVGPRPLGIVEILDSDAPDAAVLAHLELGTVQVVENMRPPFFDVPARQVWSGLEDAWQVAETGAVCAVGVTGSGGSGKSRIVEEFAYSIRRKGAHAIIAKQANTLDHPWRLLANLLIAITEPDSTAIDLSDAVLARIGQYDTRLASSATETVRSLIGTAGKGGGGLDEQKLMSILILFIRVATRRRPLLIHLQDLHWCSPDILELLERMLWQLESLHGGHLGNGECSKGILLVLEGRAGEQLSDGKKQWSTRGFESFLDGLGKPLLRCVPMNRAHSRDFISRLFDDSNSAFHGNWTSSTEMRRSLVESIDRAAGGNPFHILEQLRLFKQRGVIGQNPLTGSHFLIQPDAIGPTLLALDVASQSGVAVHGDGIDRDLPERVFKIIKARWDYLVKEKRAIAYLLWAAALFSERLPAPLFDSLWRVMAQRHGRVDLEATEFLDLPEERSTSVAFRHENYFQTLRRLTVPPAQRRKALAAYEQWYVAITSPTPQQSFELAQVLMAADTHDWGRISAALTRAREQAERGHNLRLRRRILAALVDGLYLTRPDLYLSTQEQFLAACVDELALCQDMRALGERSQALHRLEALEIRIRAQANDDIFHLQRFHCRAQQVRLLMNDSRPSQAAELAEEVCRDFDLRQSACLIPKSAEWHEVEIELRHIHSVALALAGDIDHALEVGKSAIALAASQAEATELAVEVVSTYANILLARDLHEAEALLRRTAERACLFPENSRCRIHISLNLAMCLTLLGWQELLQGNSNDHLNRFNEALNLLKPAYTISVEAGRLADAAAAALLIGLARLVRRDGTEIGWFANAVNAASMSRQMETLWRAHLNLASAIDRAGGPAAKVAEHARAAYEIMANTLSPYPNPEKCSRLTWIRVPLAHAVRFLVAAGDPSGEQALARLPSLRDCFVKNDLRRLRPDRGGFSSHEWLHDGDYDFVLY